MPDSNPSERFSDGTLPEADLLVDSDSFAFLVAVLADYRVRADRAWNLPYLLKQRLGHLDPQKVAEMSERDLERAMSQPTPLHRHPKMVARFIWRTARLLVQRYEGDASTIWADTPRTEDVQNRLDEFHGIGQKKASMATNILVRDFGVAVRDRRGIDVSSDVHVRRVFWRTGLAESPGTEDVVEAGRVLNPEYPGRLDLPAWTVGRRYCRPMNPDCPYCPLDPVCPKLHLDVPLSD